MATTRESEAQEGSFRLIVARAAPGAPVGYVIMAFGTMNDGGLLVCDVFMTVRSPDGQQAFSQFRFTFPVGSRDPSEGEAMLADYASQWLEAELDGHILRWLETLGDRRPLAGAYAFSERDPGVFGLWLREVFGAETLDAIAHRTGCVTLKRYLARTIRLDTVVAEPFEK